MLSYPLAREVLDRVRFKDWIFHLEEEGDHLWLQVRYLEADVDSDTSRVDPRRVCTWCARPLGPELRRDAKACSKKCRQAAHRFRVGVAPAGTTGPMRFAYADPPYPGLARKSHDASLPPAGETPSGCGDASQLEVRRLPSRLAGAMRRLHTEEPT